MIALLNYREPVSNFELKPCIQLHVGIAGSEGMKQEPLVLGKNSGFKPGKVMPKVEILDFPSWCKYIYDNNFKKG